THIASAVLVAGALTASLLTAASAGSDGVVRVKSAYSISETIERLKKDIADKNIKFFSEIDQSKLAADAGIKLQPSVLLVFGNPPLGTQSITSNPDAGLDWPVRLLVFENEKGEVFCRLHRLRMDRTPPRHQEPHAAVQDGVERDRLHHFERQGEVAPCIAAA